MGGVSVPFLLPKSVISHGKGLTPRFQPPFSTKLTYIATVTKRRWAFDVLLFEKCRGGGGTKTKRDLTFMMHV